MLFSLLLCPMHWPNDHIANMTMISVTWDVTITSCNCNTLKIYSSLKSQLHVRISSQSFIFHLRSITVQYNASFFIIFLPASFLQWFLLFLCFMDIRCHHHVDFRSRGTSTIHYNSSLDLINNIFCSFWSWNNNFAILWSCVLCHNYQKPCRMFQNDSETLHCPHSDMRKYRLVSKHVATLRICENLCKY